MKQLDTSTLEARIVQVLLEVYPITVAELAHELGLKESRVMVGIRSLEQEGIVSLEPLPDKTYIRLVNPNISFIGRKVTQQKSLKRKGRKKPPVQVEENIGYA